MTCSSSKPLRLCSDLIFDPKLEIAYTFYLSKDEPSSMRSINQIPVEMLREIFAKFVEVDCSELCSASKPESPETSTGSTEGTMGPATGLADPTILGQVCSYWRRVALSTPFLWSTICIIPDTKHLVAQINWTAMFLTRAGTSPLDLSLKDCRCRSAVSMQSVRPSICHSAALAPSASPTICAMRTFLSLFVSRIQYWRSIDFHLPPEAIDVLFSITNSPSPLKCDTLRSASVLISNVACNKLHADQPSPTQTSLLDNISWVNPFLATIWKSIFIPPTLKQLTWWPGLDAVFSDTPGVIFANISCLKIPYPLSTDELLDLLAYFPNIEEVAVSDLRLPKLPILSNHTHSPLALLSLEALRLTVGVDVSPLFDRLYCPALRFLTLDYSGAMTPSKDVILSLLAFLRRSESCLKELVIRHNHNSDQRNVKLTIATQNLASPGLGLLSALEVD